MSERLQKYLSRAGVCSRRQAEQFILEGRVAVNNQVVHEMGTKVTPDVDLVTVDGRLVAPSSERNYYILYKPPGVLTTLKDPQGRPTISDFLGDIEMRVYPVGRLDYDAEGALLLLDDGDLANQLMHPKFQVPRTYLAKVKGVPTPQTLEKLRGGVRLEDGMATPLAVEVFEKAEKNTWLKLVVNEGRNHLIKRMCAAIGHPVVRLFRPAHGSIGLEGLRPGDIRRLSPSEVDQVKRLAKGEKLSIQPPLKLPARRHGHGAEELIDSSEDAPRRDLKALGTRPKKSEKSSKSVATRRKG